MAPGVKRLLCKHWESEYRSRISKPTAITAQKQRTERVIPELTNSEDSVNTSLTKKQ
ncbi:hypothetical protein STEG23_004142, partial [Scotinomys teguina]